MPNIPENPYQPLSKRETTLTRLAVESVGVGIATGLEWVRASMVNPLISVSGALRHRTDLQPTLSPDSPFFPILQNAGDFYDGYLYGYLSYNLLSIADYFQGRFTHKEIPLGWKRGISLAVSAGSLTWIEAGLPFFLNATTSDPGDIPAIILGSTAYLGVNIWARRKVENMNKNIELSAERWVGEQMGTK